MEQQNKISSPTSPPTALKAAPLSAEYTGVKFPSRPAENFKVSIKTSAELGEVVLCLESLHSRAKWQTILNDLTKCGPSVIPETAVYKCLQRALKNLSGSISEVPSPSGKSNLNSIIAAESDIGAASGDPIATVHVDINFVASNAVLTLTLSMLGGVWEPQYIFTLVPIGLDRVDILEARLHDAIEENRRCQQSSQSEIAQLRLEVAALRDQLNHALTLNQASVVPTSTSELGFASVARVGTTPAFASLSSKTPVRMNQTVIWDGLAPRFVDKDHFTLSEDSATITVARRGAYQVYLQLGGLLAPSGPPGTTEIVRNGKRAVSAVRPAGGGAGTASGVAFVNEIMLLEANDFLQVKCGFSSSSDTRNRLTISFLGTPLTDSELPN